MILLQRCDEPSPICSRSLLVPIAPFGQYPYLAMFQEDARTAIERRLPRRTLEACLPLYHNSKVCTEYGHVRLRLLGRGSAQDAGLLPRCAPDRG